MRRLLTLAAALVLLSTTVACAPPDSTTADTAASAGAPTTTRALDPAAVTAEVCAQAVPLSEKAAARFLADMNNALETAASGNEADAEQALRALRGNLDGWATQLTELAGQPVEEPVRAALTASATAIKGLAKPDDNTPVGQVERALKEATAKVRSACA